MLTVIVCPNTRSMPSSVKPMTRSSKSLREKITYHSEWVGLSSGAADYVGSLLWLPRSSVGPELPTVSKIIKDFTAFWPVLLSADGVGENV
jgi:hypothetical protein